MCGERNFGIPQQRDRKRSTGKLTLYELLCLQPVVQLMARLEIALCSKVVRRRRDHLVDLVRRRMQREYRNVRFGDRRLLAGAYRRLGFGRRVRGCRGPFQEDGAWLVRLCSWRGTRRNAATKRNVFADSPPHVKAAHLSKHIS